VFGIDLASDRIELAQRMGFAAASTEESLAMASSLTNGHGFDHVLICADSTSDSPVELAGQIARDRGSVVAVGAVGMKIPRKLYYEKELQFKVSRSYGPGRYDLLYEEGGLDYPFGYVRWTENRNLQAFVNLLSSGRVDVHPLITHRFAITDAPRAYELILGKKKEPFLGVLLTYPETSGGTGIIRKVETASGLASSQQTVRVGVLGAGNFAQAVFLPAIQKTGNTELVGIATASGVSGQHTAKRYGFRYASTSDEEILNDPEINCVVILTRHQHHAHQTITALKNHKAVYCEKPLALNRDELDAVKATIAEQEGALLTVGFNRRFAPMAQQMHAFFANRSEPLFIQYRVNAGYLPLTHWLHDPQQGGGRIIGEACHFIDFLTYLTGQSPAAVTASSLADAGKYNQDNVLLTFRFPDSSIGTISYLANGNRNSGKERVETFCAGKIACLDDFRTLEMTSDAGRKIVRSPFGQDKGHRSAWANFVHLLHEGGDLPIPYEQLYTTTEASFAAIEALRTHSEIKL
jgi:predicted dehydrogenase